MLKLSTRRLLSSRYRLIKCWKDVVKIRLLATGPLGGGVVVEEEGKTRNIGIMAHIDAGKTTTTERMLYYSGFSRVLGEVDDGDTVMDYLEEERQRGITITSAAITFNWSAHRINLIDTPGHVDFTMEVERALRVLDGAITILDAATGVEAQTTTVWRQAEKYQVPRIIYINKMDKSKANLSLCQTSVEQKLGAKVLLMHLPLVDQQSRFYGVIDLLSMIKYEWLLAEDTNGRVYRKTKLNEKSAEWTAIAQRRQQLVELIADADDEIAEILLRSENYATVPTEDLEKAVRRITLSQKAVPMFCGSSYKNVAVQPLLDAVVKYLPSPNDIQHDFLKFYKDGLCSLAFKIVHDQQKGRLTFIRLYSGCLKRGQSIYNASRGSTEKIVKIFVAYADQFKEVETIGAGNIAVVTGLVNVSTGDTLVGSQKAADAGRSSLADRKNDRGAVLAGVEIPQPVFFCSIEPASLMHQKPLENALKIIQAEDPSFTVTLNEDTGQTIIAGMGELHIEIIKHRIEKEFKVEAYLGPLQVAYHETILEPLKLDYSHDRTLGSVRHRVDVHLSMDHQSAVEFTGLKVATNRETRENIDNLRHGYWAALESGVKSGLLQGPLLGYPVTNVQVWIHWCQVGSGTSVAMITAAASKCVYQMLHSPSANRHLLEPVMKLEIVTDHICLNSVLADLSLRRGEIQQVFGRLDAKIVSALVPLCELMNYSTSLRVITSGTAVFSMELDSYRMMTPFDQQKAINKIIGLT